MDEQEENYFNGLSPSNKVIFILKRRENFGGPQSADRLQEYLGMKRKNLDSILSRLSKQGRIERVSLGVYRYPGDSREPKI